MGFSARILLDSVSPAGIRLTTMEVRYPRFIHSELMTHRVFCLDGDTQLYFDLPSGGIETKRFSMSMAEFHDKWHYGAQPRPHKKKIVRVCAIDPLKTYRPDEAAEALGLSGYTAIDAITRKHNIPRAPDGPTYCVKGADLISYGVSRGEHRYSLRGRLSKMRLRSCDESTREIYHTSVTDVRYSGNQPVYRVTTADGKSIITSSEHRFLTDNGWATLREAADLSLTPKNIATWRTPVRLAVNGIDPLRDPVWLEIMRERGLSAAAIARRIGASLDQVKYRFRRYGLRQTNPDEVWRRGHTKEPWNKGRVYSNLRLRGVPAKGKVRRGPESHLWRGGITEERKLIGAWTMNQAFRIHRSNGFKCRLCGDGRELHAHHIDPVAHNPARARDVTNLTTLCSQCHDELHHRNLELAFLRYVEQGDDMSAFWTSIGTMRVQRPRRTLRKRARVAHFVDVISIDYVGVRPTYDLEVSGPYHNFVADGFIVHNSRNAASSRAIPIKKMIDAVRQDPAMPIWWGRNQTGMQANVEIDDASCAIAEAEWRQALADALAHAERLSSSDVNLHKQLVNRILEPFAWITVIITATEWSNFFTLRTHEDAQPELKHVADMMLHAYRSSTPRQLGIGDWHTPLILADEEAALPVEDRLKISVARSARVSYLTHDGSRDHAKDLELYERLLGGGSSGHWSPFEHVATPLADGGTWSGNFRGWEQYRKRFAQEHAATFPDEAPLAASR